MNNSRRKFIRCLATGLFVPAAMSQEYYNRHRRKAWRGSGAVSGDTAPPTVSANIIARWSAGTNCYNTGTTQCTDGQTVETWTDLSGNGHDATSSSNKPVWRANILNGKPAVEFSAASSYLYLAIASAYTLGNSSTFRTHVIVADNPSPVSTTWQGILGTAATSIYFRGDINKIQWYGANSPYPTPAWPSIIIVRNNSASGGTVLYRINGSESSVNSTNPVAGNASYIGAAATSERFTGKICEIISYDACLSSSDCASIESWSTTKYGKP